MRRLISILILLGTMLCLPQAIALAEDKCKDIAPVVWDAPGITDPAFVGGDQQKQYFLSINGPDWTIDRRSISTLPVTLIRCANCGNDVDGHIQIRTKPFPVSAEERKQFPQNGQERIELGFEFPPKWALRLEKPYLIPLASREGLHLDSLSGYAVLYQVRDGWLQNTFPKANLELYRDFQSSNLIVLSMWDECALLEASFYAPASDIVNWDTLDKFLHDVTIKKTTSAYVKPPPYVRPKCPDESVECLREALGLKD